MGGQPATPQPTPPSLPTTYPSQPTHPGHPPQPIQATIFAPTNEAFQAALSRPGVSFDQAFSSAGPPLLRAVRPPPHPRSQQAEPGGQTPRGSASSALQLPAAQQLPAGLGGGGGGSWQGMDQRGVYPTGASTSKVATCMLRPCICSLQILSYQIMPNVAAATTDLTDGETLPTLDEPQLLTVRHGSGENRVAGGKRAVRPAGSGGAVAPGWHASRAWLAQCCTDPALALALLLVQGVAFLQLRTPTGQWRAATAMAASGCHA